MSRGLVIAGCLSGEKDDAGVEALVGELSRTVGADVTVRARTGGRPVGATVPEALCELRAAGVGRALVVTTHLVDGRLTRLCAEAVRDAAPGFESLRLAPALLAGAGDRLVVASALDRALPARPGRVVALAGHRGRECAAAFDQLGRALAGLGREDVVVGTPESLPGLLEARAEGEVLLAPLLMALGTHARRDVLADLAGRLRASGTFVTPWPHSLSELPAVRELVVAHALSTLE